MATITLNKTMKAVRVHACGADAITYENAPIPHGASGGIRMFAVQFTKWKGARALATTSGEGVAFVQSLGADSVIVYSR